MRCPAPRQPLLRLALVWLVGLAVATGVAAQSVQKPSVSGDGPFRMNADRMTYDVNSEVVTAEGNVEVSDEARTLKADRIIYNIRDGIVRASGNISLLDPDGNVLFADEMELDEALKSGFIKISRFPRPT